jgi:hypothetical protein
MAEHGTMKGLRRHLGLRTPACAECREAGRLYMREYRSRRGYRPVNFPREVPAGLGEVYGLGARIAEAFRSGA